MTHTDSAKKCIARLALEDGSVFTGRGFGAVVDSGGNPTIASGEVVFNTAMSGYQEALTDPSYAGQILAMTAPLIGNYGVNLEDVESEKVQVGGFVVRELSRVRSNFRSSGNLDDWLFENSVLGLSGVDTRALTRRLRISGSLRGVVCADSTIGDVELIRMASNAPTMAGANWVQAVSGGEKRSWNDGLGEWGKRGVIHEGRRWRVVTLDCGAKRNILRHLVDRGCEVTILPPDSSAESIRALNPDGLFVSNGPGDPSAVDKTVAILREVAGKFPTFGICLGHQLLCLALGGSTYKLKFGHRGINHPVKNIMTGRVEITSQNHGFAVDPDSFPSNGECVATHFHLNDGTLAGFRHTRLPIFAVQYHPEASPGPHDSGYLFDLFIRMMETAKPIGESDLQAIAASTTT